MGEMTIDPKMVSHTLPKVGEVDGIEKFAPDDGDFSMGEVPTGRMTMGKPAIVVKPNTAIRVKPHQIRSQSAGIYAGGSVAATLQSR